VRLTARHQPGAFAGLCAALIIAADDVGYGLALAGQHGPVNSRTVFVAAFLGMTSAAALIGTVCRRSSRGVWLLAFVTANCLSLGFVGMFSIGPPLIVAGWLAVIALVRCRVHAPWWLISSGSLTGLAVLIVGLATTDPLSNLSR
jgi:hypothetical protein